MFNNRSLVTSGNEPTTRKRQFYERDALVFTSISFRQLRTTHLSRDSFGSDGSLFPTKGTLRLTLPRRIPKTPNLRCTFGPTQPFLPSPSHHQRQYRRVVSVRATNLTGEVRRAYTRQLIVNVSNKLSSALTLLVYSHTYQTLGQPTSSVLTMAVPNFNAASEARSGTIAVYHLLNIRLQRVPVSRYYLQRFTSVKRSPTRQAAACRGIRTHRHARVLVSLTGGAKKLIIKAKSLSRVTLK